MYKREIILKTKKEWIEYYTNILSTLEKPYSKDIIKRIFSFPFEFDTIPVGYHIPVLCADSAYIVN